MIEIVTGDSRPIFKQIVDGIHLKIATGELAAGNKLPSVRGLAMQLMINSNTVAKAYTELTSLGVVEAKKGLGLFVCVPKQMLSAIEQEKRLDDAVTHFVSEVIGLEIKQEKILKRVETELKTLKTSQISPKKNTAKKNSLGNEHE